MNFFLLLIWICFGKIYSIDSKFERKIKASDRESDDNFGWSVGISGKYAMVGANRDDKLAANAGSVYVFKLDESTGDWIEQQILTASDGVATDYFGFAISIDGDVCVIGARYVDGGMGAAYVFNRNVTNGMWNETAKLIASDRSISDYFGISVGVSGDFIVAGAHNDDDSDTDTGSAYVFKRDNVTGEWNEVKKLNEPDPEEFNYFGYSVAINGDYIVVGAYNDAGCCTFSGSANVFMRNQTDSDWIFIKKLIPIDPPYSSDDYGKSVSISGDYIVVGSPRDDLTGTNAGSAYFYERNYTDWILKTKIQSSDIEHGDYFGSAVAISGDIAIVGAYLEGTGIYDYGSAYIFKRNSSTGIWSEVTKLVPYNVSEYDEFGRSVAIDGSHAIGGSYRSDDFRGYASIYPLICKQTNDCNNNGRCVDGQCECIDGWKENEPQNCLGFSCENLNDCNEHGLCIGPNNCTCLSIHSGDYCNSCQNRFDNSTYPKCNSCLSKYDNSTYPQCDSCLPKYDSSTYPKCNSCKSKYDNSTYPQCDACISIFNQSSYPQCNVCINERFSSSCLSCLSKFNNLTYPQCDECISIFNQSSYPNCDVCSSERYTTNCLDCKPIYDSSTYPICDCNAGYEGNDCSEFNCNNNPCVQGHSICSNANTCSCTSNFTGTTPDCLIPLCNPVCSSNGKCTTGNSNYCKCEEGYEGIDCSKKKKKNNPVNTIVIIAIGSVVSGIGLVLLFIVTKFFTLKIETEQNSPKLEGSICATNCEKPTGGCNAIFHNGQVCSTGKNKWACDAVKEVQDSSGRFYRNKWHMNQTKNSFSRDMLHGVMLYYGETKDVDSFVKLMKYINQTGFLCVDPTYNKNCEVRGTTYCEIKQVAGKLGVENLIPDYSVITPKTPKFIVDEICNHFGGYLALETKFENGTSPTYLKGLIIFQLRNFGFDMKDYQVLIDALYEKYPNNLVYRYFKNGISDQLVLDLINLIPPLPKSNYICWEWSYPYWEPDCTCTDISMGWDFYFLLLDILNHNK